MIDLQQPRTVCLEVTLFEDKINDKIDTQVRVYEANNVPADMVALLIKRCLNGIDSMDINKIKAFVHTMLLTFNIHPLSIDVKIGEPREMKAIQIKQKEESRA